MLYFILSCVFTITLIIIIFKTIFQRKRDKNRSSNASYFEITVVLGSGGHTGEMCLLLKKFNFVKMNKMNVIITQSDSSSEKYFIKFVNDHVSDAEAIITKVHFHYLSRTNEVKQSFITAIFTTFKSIWHALLLIYTSLTNTTHLIANGPGTCVPLFYLFYILNLLRITRTKLIFIESWCRVTSLSLTGKLIKYVVDSFIVHWPELSLRSKGCQYYGKII